RAEANRLVLAASYSAPEAFIKSMAENPPRFDRGSVVGRIVLDRRPVRVADVLADPDYQLLDVQAAGGYRSTMGGPLLRGDELFCVIGVWKTRVEPFT